MEYPNITKLVARLRSSRELATIARFEPDDIAGVGTFYDTIHLAAQAARAPPNVVRTLAKQAS